jgi:hypothetical protein
MKREPSLLISTFFGLTPKEAINFRQGLFRQIHNIVFHGNGGYDWHTVYDMPIWLRKFTFNEINNYNNELNAKMEEAKKTKGQKSLINPDGTVKAPNFKKEIKSLKGKTNYKR